MAIDLIGDVVRDLTKMVNKPEFGSKVSDYAAQLHAERMLLLTKQAKNPQGRRYVRLSKKYRQKKERIGKNGIPDLRLGDREPTTMSTLYYQRNLPGGDIKQSTRIGFRKDQQLPDRKKYMYKHQVGEGRLAKRKIWPEEGDMKVGASKGLVSMIGEKLQRYLMQPRTIKGVTIG